MLLYELDFKQPFTTQLRGLPPNEIPLVLDKAESLRYDPTPDGKNKKRLRHYQHDIYRIRAGDYRILYTFDQQSGWVILLGVAHRRDIYDDGEPDAVTIPVPPKLPGIKDLLRRKAPPPSYERIPETEPTADETPTPVPSESVTLGRELDRAFLERIGVASQHWPVLCRCRTLDDLIAADVPETTRSLVFDAVVIPDFDRVIEGPSFRAESAGDFQRYLEGDLVTFLLRLDQEQERFVTWAVSGNGPALLKGAPGTGKSIVAVYRVRSLIAALRKQGVAEPRILFTTYTNALVASSRQLLARLLGEDASLVDVRTADGLVADLLREAGENCRSCDDGTARTYVMRARERLGAGSAEECAAADRIETLSLEYLREEIDRVIVGRAHEVSEAYVADSRAGRRVRLSQAQREAIWRVHEVRERLMAERGERTFEQNRRRAAELTHAGRFGPRYDGLIVDEAQDLSPNMLRMLVGLCRSSDRMLLTADPNQSIYGSGFRWADVHQDLRFRGRTGVLRRNYRSTAEIGSAAAAFLHGAELDEGEEGAGPVVEHVRTGPRPEVVRVATADEEFAALLGFLQRATREQRVGHGSCAVLVPHRDAGERVQKRLRAEGLRAAFMPGAQVDLASQGVKIVTFQSAKGLEFPVVALAGLRNGPPMKPPPGATAEEADEMERLNRRILYVAMTRAMQSLLVILPPNDPSPLFQSFDPRWWAIAPMS